MIWTQFFDGIYLINLPHRTIRLMTSMQMLSTSHIPFQRVNAIASPVGQLGLRITMLHLFQKCLDEGKERILVFEDDALTVRAPASFMVDIIKQLDGREWDVLSLGPNTHEPLEKISDNLLRMKKCRGLHATAYSKSGIKSLIMLLKTHTQPDTHIDKLIEDYMQPAGNCYCTYPLLYTQRNSYSDIQKEEADQSYIVERFERNTKHLDLV